MKFINWAKKNYLIIILLTIVIWILSVKINIYFKNDTTTPIIKPETTITPVPTVIVTEIINKKIFGGKTKEEILQIEPEDRDDFITELSRSEVEELDMMPNYDFSQFLPYESENFIVEKFDYQNKKLTVKPLIEDKNKIKEEVDSWLFYSNGNNPRKIEIIWNE